MYKKIRYRVKLAVA